MRGARAGAGPSAKDPSQMLGEHRFRGRFFTIIVAAGLELDQHKQIKDCFVAYLCWQVA